LTILPVLLLLLLVVSSKATDNCADESALSSGMTGELAADTA
jgi:hypothetical protein